MPFNGQLPSIKDIIKTLVDDLNRFLFILGIILFFVSLFTNNFFVDLGTLLTFVIFGWRLFSKNKTARYKENQKFLKIKKNLIHPWQKIKDSYQKRKYNIYKKCSKCKTILKLPLPSRRGIKHAKCPNCGKRLTFMVWRKEKVEVIKKRI